MADRLNPGAKSAAGRGGGLAAGQACRRNSQSHRLTAIEGALTDTHWSRMGGGRRESLLLALDARESGDFSEDST